MVMNWGGVRDHEDTLRSHEITYGRIVAHSHAQDLAGPRPLHGFTLVELLVVIAIIGTLVGLVLPALQSGRESARRTTCGNNLRQIALAVESHNTLIGLYPTGGWNSDWIGDPNRGSDWRQPGGWCFTILPFLEEKALYDCASSASTQPTFVSTNVPIFVCPSRRQSGLVAIGAGVTVPAGGSPTISGVSWMHADYAGNRGSYSTTPSLSATVTDRATTFGPIGITTPDTAVASDWQTVAGTLNTSQGYPLSLPSPTGTVPTGGVIFAGSSLASARIRDGLSRVYLIGEKYVPRTAYATGTALGDQQCAYVGDSPDTLRGGHRTPEPDSSPYATNLEGAFGGPHAGVFNMAMCDGSVRVIDFGISAQVHFLLACRADKQAVQPPD